MNRVYKVIWSKAKHCYVVTSEIAKSHTKGESTGRGLKKLAAALLVAAALMGPNFAWAADDMVTVKNTNGVDQIVYTVEGANGNFATKTDLDAKANAVDVANTYAKTADVASTYVKKDDAQVTTLHATGKATVDGNAEIGGTLTVTNNASVGGKLSADTLTAAGNNFTVGADGNVVAKGVETGTLHATGKTTVDGNAEIGGTLTVTNNASVGTLAAAGNNFTVDASGNVVAAGVNAGAGTIKTTGAVETGALHATGNATVDGNTEMKGTLKAGATTVDSLDAGSGLIKTDGTVKAGDVQTGTLTTTGNVTIGGALTVTGKLNMDEIDMTKGGIVGDNNVTASTKVAAGEITSYKKATSTKDGSEKESSFDYDENGTSTWAKATDADGKKNKSTLTVEGKGIKSIATDGKINASTNLSNKGFNTFASDGGKNKTYTKQTAESLTSQIGDDGKVQSVMNAEGISNNADGGTITNSAKDLVNTATENMTNTVGGNLTTTVTGDSSLTAENITNEAKNKITNKAIDVETDATSSIVQNVTNDAGSNTSTQWSYQTKEEMSQTDGKTASYLRGAVEEKSELIDGDVKTTIDTIAGQTNTNITDGTNTSNDLQKADQIASSVTDGTNTTVVNQDARSLASSITDGTGTKVNNSIHWVDGSAQRIEVDDTHFYAETRTAEKAEEALKSGNTVIDIVKDANTATVSSAVTDGATITGISQNAKDISLSAAGGTIASGAKNISNTAAEKLSNSAADIENKASKSILNQVGENTSWKMMDGTVVESVKDASGKTNQTTTTAADTYQFVKDGDNTLAKRTSSTNDNLNITDSNNTYTKITTATGNKQTVTDGTETASTNLTKAASNTLIENGTQSVLDHMAADTSYTVMNENGNGSRRQQTASEILDRVTDGTDTSEVKQTASEVAASAKNISNTATGDITNTAEKGTITNKAQNLVNDASNSITDKVGENVERTMTNEQIQDKVGKTTVTTTDGWTKLTDEDHNHTTEMDYANVTKDLSVYRNTTLGQEGEDTNLTVNSKSEFKDTVKMDSTLEVDGTSTFNDKVTITKNGLAVTGGTTTDTLNVTGETRTGTLHVNGNGHVGGDLNVDGNIETHDAVLSADSRQVVTGRQLYQTNERVDRLDNRIKKVGANAAALAALRPGDFNPDDKFSIAAGFGSYRNANAAALGLFYRPNENVLLSLGTSFGDGENMVNAGVSVKFGRGKSMAERRKEMADEVSSMRDEMRSQDERIAELEEMLKKQSELIEKLSKES